MASSMDEGPCEVDLEEDSETAEMGGRAFQAVARVPSVLRLGFPEVLSSW